MGLDRANTLRQQGRLAEAEAECRRALAVGPRTAEALNLMAMLLHERGKTTEALVPMRQALALAPRVAQVRINLAAMLGALGHLEEGLSHLVEAVKLRGDIPELHNNMGVILENMGGMLEAESSYRTALAIRPDYSDAHNNLGNVLRQRGKLDDAIISYNRAIELRNGCPSPYRGLAEALALQGDADGAIACRRRAAELMSNSPAMHADLLYTLHYSARFTPAQMLAEARQWAHRFACRSGPPAPSGRPRAAGARLTPPARPANGDQDVPSAISDPVLVTSHAGACDASAAARDVFSNVPVPRVPTGRLRIGYLSPDFRAHTIAHLIEPILRYHDRDRFEVFCYSSVQRPDSVTERLKGLADVWRDVSAASDEQAANAIRADRIDILVDLAGHMGGSRLLALARRPAPVQVQLGYAGTTGLPQVDYRITDPHSDPPGTEEFYSERLIRLPDCAWPYQPSDDSPEVGPPPAPRNGFVTFGCLNKTVKISDEAATTWGEVLRAVAGSRLMVLSAPDNRGLLAKFARRGLDPARVELAPPVPRAQYLAMFQRIDVALDPFPYNGDTTTCDGLWMGVPLITLAGSAFVSRRGVCYLNAIGLTDLIARDPREYVMRAARLAGDLGRLAELRLALRPMMQRSPLIDGLGYTRQLESAFLTLRPERI